MSQTKAEQLFKPLLLHYCAHIVCEMRRGREFGFSSSRYLVLLSVQAHEHCRVNISYVVRLQGEMKLASRK